MPDYLVTTELAKELVAQGIAQLPDAPPSLELPVVWADHRRGTQTPRRGDNETYVERVAITIEQGTSPPADVMTEWLETQNIEVTVRGVDPGETALTLRAVRRLISGPDQTGRRMWTIGDGLLVEHARQWRADSPLPLTDKFYGYARVQGFLFTVRSKALAGLPYAP